VEISFYLTYKLNLNLSLQQYAGGGSLIYHCFIIGQQLSGTVPKYLAFAISLKGGGGVGELI
jgi:hypothetical protein